MTYNDTLFEYQVTKMFAAEAVLLGLQNAAFLLTERESSLREALKKQNKNFAG